MSVATAALLANAAILTMDEMGTPGEGTRPTSERFVGGVGWVPTPGVRWQGHNENGFGARNLTVSNEQAS